MISRKNRFHGHSAVSRVRGRSVHTSSLSMRVAPNKKPDYRLAVVVSKKVLPQAVKRNRVRRRIFELFRTQGLLSGRSIDAVVYIKNPQVMDMPADKLSDEVSDVVRKALTQTS